MAVFRANVDLIKANGLTGRTAPTFSGYRPHIVVNDSEVMLGVKFLESMKFGDNDVIFEQLYSDVDYSSVQDGTEFTVREGGRVVATGKIIERVD